MSNESQAISKWWIPFIFFAVIWVLFYTFSPMIQDITLSFFQVIFSDWQLATVFLGLLCVSIGWEIVRALSLVLYTIYRNFGEETRLAVKAIRYYILILILIATLGYFFTIWGFNDWELYVFALILDTILAILIFRSNWFKRPPRESHVTTFSKDMTVMFIPVQNILFAALGTGFMLIYIYLNQTGTPWVVAFSETVLIQFISNPLMIVLMVAGISLTFFYPLLEILAYVLAYYSRLALTRRAKERMFAMRLWTLIFVIIMVALTFVNSAVITLTNWGVFIPEYLTTTVSMGLTMLSYWARTRIWQVGVKKPILKKKSTKT